MQLREAVAMAVGWRWHKFSTSLRALFLPNETTRPAADGTERVAGISWVGVPNYHSDDAAAFGLLKGMKDWCIEPDCESDGLIVREQQRDMSWRELASGPLDQSATVMARAFLKLKARE